MADMKRLLFALSLLVTVAIPGAWAGQLTISVIQYGDSRDHDAMVAAFAKAKLAEITDSDTVESRDGAIRGGRVLFSQTLPIAGNGSFASSTRIAGSRADVNGRLNQPSLQAEVSIQEGVNVGIRKFSRSAFSGSGTLDGSHATIIGLRESSGKTQSATKGQVRMSTYNFVTLVVAQWTK